MKTNSLIYKTERKFKNTLVCVEISLDDDCKNGHQDFSITASIYEAGKPKTDRNMIMGGCCHEEILEAFPQFKSFINLHLCDWEGVPMYAVANGYYHLKQGFNRVKPLDDNFADYFCAEYRITREQFGALSMARSQVKYGILLKELGILDQWKKEAAKAILLLQELTGDEFVVDSVRSQYDAPSISQINEELEREATGYYSQEAIQTREDEKSKKELDELEKETEAKIASLKLEFGIHKQLLGLGGKHFLENCIFYNHSKELKLNWKDYGNRLHQKDIALIKQKLVLPAGVKYKEGK